MLKQFIFLLILVAFSKFLASQVLQFPASKNININPIHSFTYKFNASIHRYKENNLRFFYPTFISIQYNRHKRSYLSTNVIAHRQLNYYFEPVNLNTWHASNPLEGIIMGTFNMLLFRNGSVID